MPTHEEIVQKLKSADIAEQLLEQGAGIAAKAIEDWGLSLGEAVDYVKTYLKLHPYRSNG
ncbi:hypothetical protein [Chitinophaga barathri]|uniref:Uncharacterized protein n=1 Tax=Chitinophaga barathri TaxID=1647451 RepID=A0A3N4MU39_9BACT|nr:hypothetical protein [Chitinophaga barathri]RPD43069.1 hypothetical protein EG028_01900 [Chitinophaga barathri]